VRLGFLLIGGLHTTVSSFGRYNRTKLIYALIRKSVLKLEVRVVAWFNTKKICITHTHTHTHTHTNTDRAFTECCL